ncbi:transmembrane protein 254-like [Anolis carolinensis]|uniref:Transmembrane protein 254 n=1 Tax=Anolis carolinensis TaxID=28377 RepID=R4GCY9_ANOCA|nr:PREDICTED: transmembrane protein 254-like [Anolis carolinensis]|eukprot:XP_008121870.1 PREDICTED: transmembrane protein 254-like [Anolis carolinensis]
MAPVPAARQGTPNPATYFRRTPLILMLMIGGTNAFHAWTFFAPQTIPYDKLGPLGTLTKYLLEHYNTPLRIWFVTIWILHTLFAFIVLKLCKEKGITDRMTQVRWFAQTVTYGLNSLFFLWIYKPPMKSK